MVFAPFETAPIAAIAPAVPPPATNTWQSCRMAISPESKLQRFSGIARPASSTSDRVTLRAGRVVPTMANSVNLAGDGVLLSNDVIICATFSFIANSSAQSYGNWLPPILYCPETFVRGCGRSWEVHQIY